MIPVIRSANSGDRKQLQGILSALPFLKDEFIVALVHGHVSAFLGWRRVSTDECEILVLESMLEWRRKGLGRALIRMVKEHVRSDLFLEVRPSNAVAVHLYESEGFTQVGIRRNYYSSPDEDALVLKFHPC